MLSSILSTLNSILDKLINEEGEIVVLLQLQCLPQQQKYIHVPPTCEECTQREISAKLGISRSYVSRIEKKALIKLRKIVSG